MVQSIRTFGHTCQLAPRSIRRYEFKVRRLSREPQKLHQRGLRGIMNHAGHGFITEASRIRRYTRFDLLCRITDMVKPKIFPFIHP